MNYIQNILVRLGCHKHTTPIRIANDYDIDKRIQVIFDYLDKHIGDSVIRKLTIKSVNDLIITYDMYLKENKYKTIDEAPGYAGFLFMSRELRWLRGMMMSHNTQFIIRQDNKGYLDNTFATYVKDGKIYILGITDVDLWNKENMLLIENKRSLYEKIQNVSVQASNPIAAKIYVEKAIYNFCYAYGGIQLNYVNNAMLENFLSVLEEMGDGKNAINREFERICKIVKSLYPKLNIFYGTMDEKGIQLSDDFAASKEACRDFINELQKMEGK